MALARKETITVTKVDNEKNVTQYNLLIDNCYRGCITQTKNGEVKLNFGIAGPLNFEEAKVILQGFLELSVIGEELTLGITHGKNKRK